MNPDLLERLLGELDARILPAQDAALHRGAMVGPDGRDLTPAEALAWRAHAHDAAMRVYLEIARDPKTTLGIADLRPIPWWVQAGILAGFVTLLLWQGFQMLLILLLWLKF